MTPLCLGCSTTSTTNARYAELPTIYIYTTSSFVLMAETMRGQTFWPSVSTATSFITAVIRQ